MQNKEIKLRAPEPEDIALLYEWENDTTVWQVSNTYAPFSHYTLRKHIENSNKSIFETGQLRFMIDRAADGKTIGIVDIFDFDPMHLRAGIGILIADREARQKGYATMAIESVINYTFSRLKLHQLYCNILEDNTASIQLFTKLGFKKIGTKKEWIRSGNIYLDEIMFQLLNV